LASAIRCRLSRRLYSVGIDRWGAYLCFGSKAVVPGKSRE
jgi:hypothetical protein